MQPTRPAVYEKEAGPSQRKRSEIVDMRLPETVTLLEVDMLRPYFAKSKIEFPLKRRFFVFHI